ncbi:MAG: hypothetical protein EBT75_02590 [Proteobacteria bacterium]|nr:hypothetical protein [Pseudomonadota bacterium]
MTKISQRSPKKRAQTYEEKVAEVHEKVLKPILAEKIQPPKPDYFGIFLGTPVFFLALPLMFLIYFPMCAIITESAKLVRLAIDQLVRLL